MNSRFVFLLLIAFGLSNCALEGVASEDIDGQWTLIGYANSGGGIGCTYNHGDIIWSFEDNKLEIGGRLISPTFIYTPCYIVDPDGFTREFTFRVLNSDIGEILSIDDLDLTAKISIEEEMVIEVITSSEFEPSKEGVKVFFKRL